MFTTREVYEGLRKGLSYKRTPTPGVFEYVKPSCYSHQFNHTVVGPDYGGVADLDLSILFKPIWDSDDWELLEERATDVS
jgi:hypothetical protein